MLSQMQSFAALPIVCVTANCVCNLELCHNGGHFYVAGGMVVVISVVEYFSKMWEQLDPPEIPASSFWQSPFAPKWNTSTGMTLGSGHMVCRGESSKNNIQNVDCHSLHKVVSQNASFYLTTVPPCGDGNVMIDR